MTLIRQIDVVIPARNEEALIGRCLDSVLHSIDFARAVRLDASPGMRVTVVADGCTDATENIVAGYSDVCLESQALACVGAARAHGVRIARERTEVPASEHWILNTDADSVVPQNWVAHQLLLADSGYDLIVGTVRPELDGLSRPQRDAWEKSHIPGKPNGHVHGANLGFRADLYLAAGGYRDQAEHEDNDLVNRMLELKAETVASDAGEVVTSARRYGRTPGGYAGYLRLLDSDSGISRPSASPVPGESDVTFWKA